MKSFRICMVSSEVTPFAKTGGLADVASGLSRYLARAGHDVRLFMPLYQRIREGGWALTPLPEQQGIEMQFGRHRYRFGIQLAHLPRNGSNGNGNDGNNVPVYLIDCPGLFDRVELYTNDEDEPLRFGLLVRGVLESCQRMQWGPDVFHLNDWHTGLLPLYLRTSYAWDRIFARSKTLMTIHNIAYQGTFDVGVLHDLGLMEQRRHLPQDDLEAGRVNFLKAGLLHADALSTVSRTYADEIQTPEFGMGLHSILQLRRGVLRGIVNGVDYGDWDPAKDPQILHHYSPTELAGKVENKRELLAGFGLEFDRRVPLLAIVSRLTGQKGFDLLPDILPILLQHHDLRICVLGSGENRMESYFQWLRDTYPDKVAVFHGYNDQLAHRIEAGADMFLMPSRYEPCGLNQMYSLKYGTVPIVRRTGGLADTVQHFDPRSGEGTGFVFEQFESKALYQAILQALQTWASPASWTKLVRNGMAKDYSWERQGALYETLYRDIIGTTT
jgi:starch synthase